MLVGGSTDELVPDISTLLAQLFIQQGLRSLVLEALNGNNIHPPKAVAGPGIELHVKADVVRDNMPDRLDRSSAGAAPEFTPSAQVCQSV